MNSVLRVIIAVTAMCIGVQIADADSLSQAQQDLALATAQLAAKQAQLAVVQAEQTTATAQKTLADSQLATAQVKLAIAQERLKSPAEVIKGSSGTLTVIRDQRLTCNAAPFLRFTCNNTAGCTFPVDDKICGYPGSNTDAMELSVSYRCGDATINDVFESGKPAYLTCN